MLKTLFRSGLLLALCWPGLSLAQQVNRCTDAQGRTVYSDRRCQDMGATSRLPATAARAPGRSGLYQDSCARRLSDLVSQIQSASSAKDVNRLSSIYLWSGVSKTGADHVIERLEDIVQRPLVDIAPIFPAAVEYQSPSPTFIPADDSAPSADTSAAPVERSERRPRPVGLRLQQTLRNSATPSSTTLRLRRQYNCFWITL